jgi:hypothetical protein
MPVETVSHCYLINDKKTLEDNRFFLKSQALYDEFLAFIYLYSD